MNGLEELYQQIILDASKERHGEGKLEDPDGESFQVNPTCGDQVTMQVQLSDDGTRLEDIKWDGHGCSISQASISIMSDMLEGKSIDDLNDLYRAFREMMDARGEEISEDLADILADASAFQGVSKFPARIKCALLGWMALREATDEALERYAPAACEESRSEEGSSGKNKSTENHSAENSSEEDSFAEDSFAHRATEEL